MALCEQTAAIVVIGVTGSGKSTFINLASGSNLPVNKPLEGYTNELESSTFSLDGRAVMLIDTPGFDDTTPSVLGILKLISDHFSRLYSQGVKLAGVIYMHCVAEERMRDQSKHNFRVFSKFCGHTSLQDVLVVTNDWPGEPNGSEAPEQEFGPAIDKGVRILYHDGSQASAHGILRHLLNRGSTVPPAQGDSLDQRTSPHVAAGADAVRELTNQVEDHTKAIGKLCHGIDAATLAEDEATRRVLQEEAKDSLEKIERIRHDLERMVTTFATENSRLEDENRRYKNDFTAQKAEAELRVRLHGEERRARELAEAERERAEAQLAEERAFWERQKMESLGQHRGQRYGQLFACGAIIFALLCISRFAFDGSVLLS